MTALRKLPLVLPTAERELDVAPGDAFGWRDILLLIRRRLVLIAVVVLTVCLLALPAILSIPRLYYAQTRIMIEPSPTLALTSDTGGRTAPLQIEAEIEQLMSHAVSTAVIRRFDLADLPEFNEDLRPTSIADQVRTWVRESIYSAIGMDSQETGEPDTPANRVMGAYHDALAVSRQGITNVVTVGFYSEDPDLADEVPAAVVDTYLDLGNKVRHAGLSDAIAWLDKRIITAKRRIDETRAEIDRVTGREGPEGRETVEVVTSRLRRLEGRQQSLVQNRAEIADARASIAVAEADPDIPALSEPPRLQAMRAALQSETDELDRITSVYGEGYGAVTFREDRIADLRAEIADELKAHDMRLDTRDGELEEGAELVGGEIAELRVELGNLRRLEPEIERLSESLRARQAILSELEIRRTALLSEAEVEPLALDVLAPTVRPVDSLGPSRTLYMLGTLTASTLLALIVAGLADLRDGTIRSPEQLPRTPQAASIGLVPRPTASQGRNMRHLLRSGSHVPTAQGIRDALFLLKWTYDDALPTLLVVASARRRDGTGPVAEWLATALARSGTPVWLVDAGGESAADPQFDDDGITRISLRNACAEGGGMATALATLEALARDNRGIVLVDAPPLHLSEGLELVRTAGSVLLVLRWGRTPRELVALIFGLISRLGPVRLTTLIVGVKPRRHRLYGFSDRLSLVRERQGGWRLPGRVGHGH